MQEEKKKSENLAKILHIESLVAGISNEVIFKILLDDYL